MKKALVTGITGQDGAYLADLLLKEGYEVYGSYRRSSSLNLWRLEELGIANEIKTVAMDLVEYSNVFDVIQKIQPEAIYNLAAQSFVGASFEQPIYTSSVNSIGVLHLLEAIRHINPEIRFYQASTSEMFGKVQEIPQSETTPFYPRSPYGVAKLYAHWMTINYRESYNMHASSGILFNHESPFRGEEFVTRKITSQLAQIRLGKREVLELGNLEAKRDWGYAKDYVQGIHKITSHPKADDFILATGETHSVREFIEIAAKVAEFDLSWEGEGANTKAIDKQSNKTVIQINKDFYRPAEVDLLIGDPTKSREILGWQSETSFENLVVMMMQADLRRVKA